MRCNHDCFNCIYEDCINDDVYREKSLYKYRSEQSKANNRAYQKKRRDEAKAKGLCIVCCKKPATNGSKCYECFLRQKRYDKRKNTGERAFWKENGLCYYCGKPTLKGKKVCIDHYKILLKNIEICNKSNNEKPSNKRGFGRYTGWKDEN